MIIAPLLLALAASGAANADIEIKSARLDYARAANTFGYSAVIANRGPDEARNVEVSIVLPPGASVRNAEPCEQAGDIVRCALGTLKAGEERRVFMLVLTAAQKPDIVAFAVSDANDPDAWNNARRATTP